MNSEQTMQKTAQCSDILARITRGDRLAPDEALTLARFAPVHDLGEAACARRTAMHGTKAFYVYNQHLNYTNVCSNACRFCAFSKRAGDEGAYVHSVEKARELILARAEEPIREIHVVGGLNPDLPFAYYLDLIRAIKECRPGAAVKAFTAVEIAFLADKYAMSVEQVFIRLREAGLDALPGGGAEVFAPHMRERLCPEKVSGRVWLDVHEQAHAMGLPTNCTMLFGHIESWEDRIEHLSALRDLQDRSSGFLCFIPLAYQPMNNELNARGPSGEEFLRMMAVSRLFLDNIPHIKAYWAFAGIKAAQLALWAGADDFDGTLVEEKIGHAAGAESPRGLTVDRLRQYIASAGFIPVERDTFFQEVSGIR
ncbi:MAG TPA: aminofutalosine synthase MqnE [Desulfomicrobiaceae bacterium]|nr:aminofutalosine synthase MqnE [Desulfomicrobiaceae bacterium]